jgi:hypothetical protein
MRHGQRAGLRKAAASRRTPKCPIAVFARVVRGAMRLGGPQIVFVCHRPPVWELADSILSLNDGCVIIDDRGTAITEFRSGSSV